MLGPASVRSPRAGSGRVRSQSAGPAGVRSPRAGSARVRSVILRSSHVRSKGSEFYLWITVLLCGVIPIEEESCKPVSL